MSKKYNEDYLIKTIEEAAATFTSYESIASEAKVRVETLWRIRKKKNAGHNTQTAKKIFDAIEVLKKKAGK